MDSDAKVDNCHFWKSRGKLADPGFEGGFWDFRGHQTSAIRKLPGACSYAHPGFFFLVSDSHLSINLSLNPFYVGWSEHITTDLGSIFQHTRQQSSSKLRVWRYVFLIIWQLRSLANIVYWTMDSRISSGSSACPGPGKLPMFGVRENPKIRPQFRMIVALKSAHLDKTYYVISKKEREAIVHISTIFASEL